MEMMKVSVCGPEPSRLEPETAWKRPERMFQLTSVVDDEPQISRSIFENKYWESGV